MVKLKTRPWKQAQITALENFQKARMNVHQVEIPGATIPTFFDDRVGRCIRLISGMSPSSVLDIGCGDGFFLRELRPHVDGHAYFAGIDRDKESIAKACEMGADCRVGELEELLPFESAKFDVVFAGEIIEHVADPDFLLSEIKRVLKVNGVLVLTTPNLLCWYNRILMLFGVTPMFVEQSFRANYGPSYSLGRIVTPAVGHLRIFNYVPLRSVLFHCGFEVDSIKGAARLPVKRLWWIDKLISRVRPQMAAQFIVTATNSERASYF